MGQNLDSIIQFPHQKKFTLLCITLVIPENKDYLKASGS